MAYHANKPSNASLPAMAAFVFPWVGARGKDGEKRPDQYADWKDVS